MALQNFSMTPPLTPSHLGSQENDEELDYMNLLQDKWEEIKKVEKELNEEKKGWSDKKCVMFDCWRTMFSDVPSKKNSYVKNGVLKSLINCESLLTKEFNNVTFMNNSFDSEIFISNMDHYFMRIRQIYNQVELNVDLSIKQPFNQNSVSNVIFLRTEIVKFFSFVVHFIENSLMETKEADIATHLYELLQFIGPIDLFSFRAVMINTYRDKELNVSSSFFHLNLDIRFWLMNILYMIEDRGSFVLVSTRSSDGELLEQTSSFDAVASSILLDIFDLLKKMYRSNDGNPFCQLSGVYCCCCHELGISLVNLLNMRKIKKQKENFWELTRSHFIPLLKKHSDLATSSDCRLSKKFNDLEEIWWIFFHLSELCQYDAEGNKQITDDMKNPVSEPKLFRTILRVTFDGNSTGRIEEKHLRFFMMTFLKLLDIWKIDRCQRASDCVVVVWEYLSKNLNNTFYLGSSTVEGLASQCKTPTEFVQLIMSLNGNPDSIKKSETSWQIFLRIIVAMLHRSDQEWRMLRGRIYSKFHEKKMAELSCTGIYNISFLFLVIAFNGDTPNLCSKLSDLLSLVSESDCSKLKMVIMGFMSIAVLLTKKNCSLTLISEKISQKLNRVSQTYNSVADGMQKRDYGQLFAYYSESVQQILASSEDLHLEEMTLVQSIPISYISNASLVEHKSIYNLLYKTVQKISEVSNMPHCRADGSTNMLLTNFWKNFGGLLANQCTSMTPPEMLSNILCEFVICSSKIYTESTSHLKDQANHILALLLDNDNILLRLSCESITLLVNSETDELLIRIYPKFEDHCISRFLAAVVILGKTDVVQSASEAIIKLPCIKSSNMWSSDAIVSSKMLFSSLVKQFDESQDFREKMAIKEQAAVYTKVLDKSFAILLKKPILPSHTSEVMEMLGIIISEACHLIYVKGKPTCPLPSLLRTLVLPTWIYNTEKPITKSLSEALSRAIPKVLSCLASLYPVNSSDPYISRSFRDIIVNYIHRYQIVTHPFLNFFTEEEKSKCVQKIFIDILNDQFIAKRKCPSAQLQLVLGLLLRLLSCDAEAWNSLLCPLVFPNLLENLLYIDDLTTRRSITDLLKRIFQENHANGNTHSDHLLGGMQNFVASQLSWFPNKVFRILSVLSVINKSLIVDSLPKVMETIRRTEDKRGTGVDLSLRKGYMELLNQLHVDQDLYKV